MKGIIVLALMVALAFGLLQLVRVADQAGNSWQAGQAALERERSLQAQAQAQAIQSTQEAKTERLQSFLAFLALESTAGHAGSDLLWLLVLAGALGAYALLRRPAG